MGNQVARLNLRALILVCACGVMGQAGADDAGSPIGGQGRGREWHMAQAGSARDASAAQRAAALRAASQSLAPAQREQSRQLFDTAVQLFQSGDFDAAKLAFERGLNIDPANGQARYYFAETLIRLKLNQQAREQYELAQALAPTTAEGLKAEAALMPRPGEIVRDCPECPEIMLIPAGGFMMGAPPEEKRFPGEDSVPQHRVTIARPFGIGKYEVTRAQFSRFVLEASYSRDNRCFLWPEGKEDKSANWESPGFAQGDNEPVVCVSWSDAKAYAAWLSRKTGKRYRLPSEAEWEYAARARTTTAFSSGTYITPRQANFRYRPFPDSQYKEPRFWDPVSRTIPQPKYDRNLDRTSPVGRYPPNAFGLYDMHGNAAEWTEDCHVGSYDGAPSDGSAWTSKGCVFRMVRGGSWYGNEDWLRSAYRLPTISYYPSNDIGFRVVREY